LDLPLPLHQVRSLVFIDPQGLYYFKKTPSEGSPAAVWHASIGNVTAGSLFVILQALGAAPQLLVVIGALTGAAGCFIHYLWKNFWDEDKCGESPIVVYLEK